MAVLAVLLYHGGFGWARGGFLGVSLFFTLSGFLITSLLLRERLSTGRIDLRAFWVRRLRRLVPASLLGLGLAVVTAVAVLPVEQRAAAVLDVRAALANLANWRFVLSGSPYASDTSVASPVQHYWSLAIEEQFYLVMPLLAALALRKRVAVLTVALGAVVCGSLAVQLAVEQPMRVYFGTDARAAELAVGGLLAIAHGRLRVLPWRSAALAVLGWGAAAASVIVWAATDLTTPALYRGGFAAMAFVSAVVIFTAPTAPGLVQALSWSPLVGLGRISYGVYVFHFPIFLILSESRTGVDGVVLFGLRLAVTLVAAVMSFVLVEGPIRAGRLRPRLAPVALASGVAAVLVVTGTMPVPRVAADEPTIVIPVTETAVAPVPMPVSTPTTAAPAPAPSSRRRLSRPAAPAPAPPAAVAPALRAPRIVVVGDSTAGRIGEGLASWGTQTGRLSVTAIVSSGGCAVASGTKMKVREGYEFVPKGCDKLWKRAAEQVARSDADAVVAFIGFPQACDWQFPGTDGWHSVGGPVVDGRYAPALTVAVADVAEARVPLLWATVPQSTWDVDQFGRHFSVAVPGSGEVTCNDPTRVARVNELDATTMERFSTVRRFPFGEHLTAFEQSHGGLRPDGLHMDTAAVGTIADAWLFEDLATAYRTVVLDRTAAVRPPGPTTWAPAA